MLTLTSSYTGARHSAHTHTYPHIQVPVIAYICILIHRCQAQCSHSHMSSYTGASRCLHSHPHTQVPGIVLTLTHILIYRCLSLLTLTSSYTGARHSAHTHTYTVNRAWLSLKYKVTNMNLLFDNKDFKFLKKGLLVQDIIYIFSFWK